MSGHGPDAGTFERASAADTSVAHHVRDTMAFMFETRTVIHPTAQALALPTLQQDYWQCWQGLRRHFDPTRP
jgi:homogentisate 1,2-dioxygenase